MRNVEIFDLYSMIADSCLAVKFFFKPQGVTVSGPFSEVRIREELLQKRMFSFGHCPNYLSPPPPNSQLVQLFLDVKNNVLTCITEPSNDDYDNDVCDNCDHNFGTFDDFGVKNGQKSIT